MTETVYKILACAMMLPGLVGCDEGRIYDDAVAEQRAGTPARLDAVLSGYESWPDGYTLALAGFRDGNEYAVISKNVKPGEGGRVDVVLEGVPEETSTVDLCVVDRLRRRVSSFISVPFERGDTVRLEGTSVDVSPERAIQKDIFTTTCAQCHGGVGHGGSGHSAAGLDLTEGHSFAQLIGVPSVKEEGRLRVKPGDAGESVLYRILSTDESASWHYDHSVEVTAQEKLQLIKNWIDNY